MVSAFKQEDFAQRKIKLDLALMLFHQYLNGSGKPGEIGYIEPSGWREERSTAWGYIAEIAILTGHPEVALGAYQNAIDEAPEFTESQILFVTAWNRSTVNGQRVRVILTGNPPIDDPAKKK